MAASASAAVAAFVAASSRRPRARVSSMARIFPMIVMAVTLLAGVTWADSDTDAVAAAAAATSTVDSDADVAASDPTAAIGDPDVDTSDSSVAASNRDAAESSTPPLNIDPQLRRALLQALTRLEKEAEEEAARLQEQEHHAGDSLPPATEETPASATSQSHGDFGTFNGAGSSAEQNGADKNGAFSFSDSLPSVNNPSIGEITSTHQDSSFDNINFPSVSNSEGSVQLSQEARANANFEILPENSDIQSNIISTSNINEKNDLFKGVSSALSSTVSDILREPPLGKDGKTASFTKINGQKSEEQFDENEKEVSIFQAPLVAAFTLHHDVDGLPKKVVPLFRPRPTAATPTRETSFQSISKQRELEQRTIQLQQQLFNIQQQQERQQTLLKEQQLRQERLRQQQQQLLLEQERKQQLLQEQQRILPQQQLQQQILLEQQQQRQRQINFQQQQRPQFFQTDNSESFFQQQQQQFFPIQPSSHLRSQRQETGTAIIDFQKSLSFPFVPPAQTSIPHHNTSPQTNTFFSQPSVQTFASNQDNQAFAQVQRNIPQFSAFPNQQLSLRPGFISTPSSFQRPPPVDKQLQNLLYQSGIARDLQSNAHNGASPVEDLNILSKVLSLNHEPQESTSNANSLRSSRTTLEGNHARNIPNVQPPSLHLTAPLI